MYIWWTQNDVPLVFLIWYSFGRLGALFIYLFIYYIFSILNYCQNTLRICKVLGRYMGRMHITTWAVFKRYEQNTLCISFMLVKIGKLKKHFSPLQFWLLFSKVCFWKCTMREYMLTFSAKHHKFKTSKPIMRGLICNLENLSLKVFTAISSFVFFVRKDFSSLFFKKLLDIYFIPLFKK